MTELENSDDAFAIKLIPYIVNKLSLLLSISLLLATFSLPGQIQGADYFDEHYLLQDRLARGLVFDVLQDQFGFMWFATEYGLVQYDGVKEKSFVHEPGNLHSLASNVITAIAEDRAGNLWVGTQHSGVHFFDRSNQQFKRFQHEKDNPRSIGHNKVNEVLVTKEGAVWVTTEGGGVAVYNAKEDHFIRFEKPAIESLFTYALWEDKEEGLWLGSYFGLSQWSPNDSLFQPVVNVLDTDTTSAWLKVIQADAQDQIWMGFQQGGIYTLQAETGDISRIDCTPAWPSDLASNHIWDIHIDSFGHAWVATDGALLHLALDGGKDQSFQLSSYHLSTESRYLCIYPSKDGVYWVGTNDGVIKLVPKHKLFQLLVPLKTGESIDKRRGVTTFSQHTAQQTWVGTNSGLFQYDAQKEQLHQDFLAAHPALRQLDSLNISALYQDTRGRLWIGTIEGFNLNFGLYRYDIHQRRLIDYSAHHLFLHSYATFSVVEDPSGDIWLGNRHALVQYQAQFDNFRVIKTNTVLPNEIEINQLLFRPPNSLWIGTNNAGFLIFNTLTKTLLPQSDIIVDSNQLINPRIIALMSTADSSLLLGAGGGLLLLDPILKSVQGFDSRNGLGGNLVKSMLQDQVGDIWIASSLALSRFKPAQAQFTSFHAEDGMQLREFWDRSSFLAPSGQLYFGGDNGMLLFHPDNIQNNKYVPPVIFTNFYLFNKEVKSDVKNKLLPAPIYRLPTIRLQHSQNVFTIHFAALSFINPEKTQYAVRMEGFEDEWQEIGHQTAATYTNLDPGIYDFQVKAANNDGRWNELGASLKIVVLPPWYLTWWALLLYFVVGFAALLLFYRFQLNKRLAEVETRQLRQLDAIKTQLYTNITHEFRTPLTLIQGPVERALEDASFRLQKIDLDRIRQNCKRLLKLIEQMLNLNKLEAGALKVEYQHGDIIPALKYITDSFMSYAESQGISLETEFSDHPISMDYDRQKLFDIVSNLLSNAIKFTSSGGRVKLQVVSESTQLAIHVTDTGHGIPTTELDKVFDQFYQIRSDTHFPKQEVVRSGSGIGLALSKRLAELMGGQLSVKSEFGLGSTFSLWLPIQHLHTNQQAEIPYDEYYVPIVSEAPLASDNPPATAHGPKILIVEDNISVAHFIAESIPSSFSVIMAHDGRKGIELAQAHIPDLIITDVMMPKMDGFELTTTLKEDQRTSHVPIILLTAKADLESKIAGLRKGGDAYLTKPFNRQELIVQIENLLETRRRLQSHYLTASGLLDGTVVSEKVSRIEHTFIKKVRQLIESQITAGSYSIDALAKDLHLSPSQLYRKMMALTGQSTSKFLRQVQIKKAVNLLRNTDLNINEIAYQTGFNEPAYFTRVFSTEIGVSPSAYRQQSS